jgi:histone-lysine N-methyltransferase SETMAR
LKDRRISAKSVAEQLGISREWVRSVIHEDLDMRKVTKRVLFLHDNAPAHRVLATQKKLAYLGFQCIDDQPYSPDLAPSDYHLFPGLKRRIERSPFSSEAVIAAAKTWLDGQLSDFFFFVLSGLQKLEHWAKCIELCREYVE